MFFTEDRRRRKFNADDYEYARNICVAKDGTNCIICHKPLADQPTPADIHHIDGDTWNNPPDGSNWGLTHHACNVLEYYIRKRMEAIDGTKESHIQYQIGTRMELSWMRWMIDTITKTPKGITWDEARFTGALEADCSPVTTLRYLQKHVVNSEHPKALFKTIKDENYNNKIVFTEHANDYMNRFSDLQ